ncbi:MAG: hypothetical protein ABIP58_03705 [Dehalococcoidia bacterium]
MKSNPGLCADCAFSRIVETRRESAFSLCLRSGTDPAFPRYPQLPVILCSGYEARHSASEAPAN